MSERAAGRRLPRLRWYLLGWFAGCAMVMVVAYTELLDYYLQLGINLRTESFLDQTAANYADGVARGAVPTLPVDQSLVGYRNLADVPVALRGLFRVDRIEHGRLLRYVNLNFDDDDDFVAVDTGDLCPDVHCDLVFLFPYQLGGDDWLYLVHGVVGSDAIYDELELTDRVAFVIGSAFVILFMFVSFLGVRSIDAPLRRLERWSSALSSEPGDATLPELRFRELHAVAERLQFAFERVREGVNKEKLFLRHASHELRTPIAILAANVELIDRLTSRPERSAAEQAALVRQYRALDDVQLLIETLLWINRQSDNLPRAEQIDLRAELDGIVENYRYLLDDRPVALQVDGRDVSVHAPAAAVRIVLSNLVRNAFQYTVDGDVRIAVSTNQVFVENSTAPQDAGQHTSRPDDHDGFGLGLELVALICGRFGWRCDTTETADGRQSVVHFAPR